MIDISRMAKAAGIGSAVGAVGGLIKATNDSEPNTSENVLGGIVGGALVGSIGGAGISAGRQALNAKRIAKAYSNAVSDKVTKEAVETYTKYGLSDNVRDLNVAKQVSQATAGNTAPIRSSNANQSVETLIDDFYGDYAAENLHNSTSGRSFNERTNFKETKKYRKWYVSDPFSDGEAGINLEIRQRKSDGMFETRTQGYSVGNPEYYSKPSKWEPYSFT